MATKVIVIGGGVAGMTVAHELAQRDGFEVVVYEQRAVPGGKARSIDAVGHETGVRGLPGEHGFRFFPGFYRHVTDTMSQIPFGPGGTVFDNLTQSTRVEIAQRGKRALVAPAQFPGSIEELLLALQTGWDHATQLGIPLADQLHFYDVLGKLLCACKARRFDEFENQNWLAVLRCPASIPRLPALPGRRAHPDPGRGPRTRDERAHGRLHPAAAAPGHDAAGAEVDRVLNGPTSYVWINPWLSHIRDLGVEYRLGHRVEVIHSRGIEVTGISGHQVAWPGQRVGSSFADRADHYVSAVPVEVMQSEIKLALNNARRS